MFKKNTTNKKNIFKIILFLIFLVMLLYSLYEIITWSLDNKRNEEIYNDIKKYIYETDEKGKDIVDFESLKKINEEICGWIKVNNTNIDYPVVKTFNNEYYLNHDLEKNVNKAGSIFVDCNNKLDGTDKNIVLYGHNMQNGTMFSSLKNILNKEWQENTENRDVTFITENSNSKYRVFSVYETELEDYYINTDFSEGVFSEFVNTIKSRSIYNFNVDVDENDKILTLSTCGENSKYRLVLHAKLINN